MTKDWYVLDLNRPFVIFGDDGTLSIDEVTGADLVPVRIKHADRFHESCVWSAGCCWYFIVVEGGILLARVGSLSGYLCKKRSARFFELFANAPLPRGRR